MSGLPAHVIWVQSKVMTLRPKPDSTPKTWFSGILLGRIQHIHENIDSPVKRYP